ncbi:hypothetical protein SGCZBJ_13505 [Caulobacter zeae]|uniref:Uncharacterized protein n=1 Tax=Caulobacter zeae TaxID=2055137 RepID=A0A2N5DDZ4_9CAUL|nr:hypothetical protein [Caulobacter zeae]PLR24290.1 hypothetical protein SGCZBJ_13505 [Caulobacter zeae]
MKEGPIGVRRYWTIGCLAIVLTMLCVSALPQTPLGSFWNYLGSAIEALGCAILLLIGRRRLGARANLAFLGPVIGAIIVCAFFTWSFISGPPEIARPVVSPQLCLSIALLGVEMGSVLQFLIIGFIGQGGAVKKG